MKLLTKALRKRFEQIGRQEDSSDPIVICKFFDPCGSWTWYATEFDGDDTFFGYVVGFEKEWGYFSLSELESVTKTIQFVMNTHDNSFKAVLPIERDLYFRECHFSEIPEYHR